MWIDPASFAWAWASLTVAAIGVWAVIDSLGDE